MEKIGFILAAICLCFILGAGVKSCKKTSEANLKIEKENGYKKGFNDGKQKAEEDFLNILEQNKKNYEFQLEKDKAAFEQRVTESYNEGLQKGIAEMTEEINSAITINTETKQKTKSKKSKKNWNEIISTGGE